MGTVGQPELLLAPMDRALVRDAEERLRTLRLGDEGDPLALFVDVFAALADTSHGAAYTLRRDDARWRVSDSRSRGITHADGASLAHALDEVAAAGERFGLYDPANIEASQRNVVVTSDPWRRVVEGALPQAIARLPLTRDEARLRLEGTERLGRAMRPFGLYDLCQVRVLVCDGAAMLAWIGAYRDGPFTPREVTRIRAVMPAILERSSVEGALGRMGASPMIATMLEHVAGEAYLVGAHDEILFANAAGRVRLDRDGGEARARVREAARGGAPAAIRSTLTERGIAPMRLVVLRATGDRATRACAAAASRYALTAREAEVLQLLVRGTSNLSIAATHDCSERTVEVHVARILRKFGCATRAEVMARVLLDDA
jgi:DNA-binding CsgD family transcriptional regulator